MCRCYLHTGLPRVCVQTDELLGLREFSSCVILCKPRVKTALGSWIGALPCLLLEDGVVGVALRRGSLLSRQMPSTGEGQSYSFFVCVHVCQLFFILIKIYNSNPFSFFSDHIPPSPRGDHFSVIGEMP